MYLYTAAAVVGVWGRQVLGFVLAFEFSTPCPEAVGLRAMGYKNNMTPNSKASFEGNVRKRRVQQHSASCFVCPKHMLVSKSLVYFS